MDRIANSVTKDGRFSLIRLWEVPKGYIQSLKTRITRNAFVMLVFFMFFSSGYETLFSGFSYSVFSLLDGVLYERRKNRIKSNKKGLKQIANHLFTICPCRFVQLAI